MCEKERMKGGEERGGERGRPEKKGRYIYMHITCRSAGQWSEVGEGNSVLLLLHYLWGIISRIL